MYGKATTDEWPGDRHAHPGFELGLQRPQRLGLLGIDGGVSLQRGGLAERTIDPLAEDRIAKNTAGGIAVGRGPSGDQGERSMASVRRERFAVPLRYAGDDTRAQNVKRSAQKSVRRSVDRGDFIERNYDL